MDLEPRTSLMVSVRIRNKIMSLKWQLKEEGVRIHSMDDLLKHVFKKAGYPLDDDEK